MRALLSVLAGGLAGALALAGRIFERGEPLNGRTAVVIALGALGGMAGVGLALLGDSLLARHRPRATLAPRALAAFGLGIIGFVAASAAAFALHDRIIQGHADYDEEGWRAIAAFVFSHVGALGLYVTSGRVYLLPWPLPLIGLAAGLAVLVRRR